MNSKKSVYRVKRNNNNKKKTIKDIMSAFGKIFASLIHTSTKTTCFCAIFFREVKTIHTAEISMSEWWTEARG